MSEKNAADYVLDYVDDSCSRSYTEEVMHKLGITTDLITDVVETLYGKDEKIGSAPALDH